MADYITTTEGDVYAAAHLDASAWTSAPAARKSAAISQATVEIDSCRWQGAKYDPAQAREFPRIIDPTRVGAYPNTLTGSAVWDWDSGTNAAVVPANVKRACFEQAVYLLRDDESTRILRARRLGLLSQAAGAVSESYAPASVQYRAMDVLCPMAITLMRRYVLRSGRLV